MLTKTLSEAKKKQRNILIKAMNNDIGSIDSAKDSWNPAQISERAKDISYIRSLVDTWNPAQLNEALRMLDLPVIDTWNPAQIEEQRRNLVFYLAERTLTGDPITVKILGNLTPEVTSLKVTMNPIQSGSGDPSPTNVRPISGRTEVRVTRTAGEDVETKTHEYSETIYGGVDDFINGGATSTMSLCTISDLTNIARAETITSDVFRFSGNLSVASSVISSATSGFLSSKLKNATADSIYRGTADDGTVGFNGNVVYFRYDEATTPEELVTALGDCQICYNLATAATVETTPEEITLLKGTNVLSTDGDSIELKYKQNF